MSPVLLQRILGALTLTLGVSAIVYAVVNAGALEHGPGARGTWQNRDTGAVVYAFLIGITAIADGVVRLCRKPRD